MTAASRAAASVLMLIGFYLVALLQLAAVIALIVWVASLSTGVIGIKLGLPLLFAVGATAVGLWRAIRTRPGPPDGVAVGPERAPELWQTVRALSAEVGTRMPDEIRFVAEVNAAVTERVRLLGLIGGHRLLYIGLPLMQSLSVGQIRAILAHELGHFSGRHTRLGAVAYRGRLAIGETISRIGPANPVGWVFKGYARLYLLVDNAASRRQELEADRASVRVAGRAVATSALRELPLLDTAWGFYFSRYVQDGWDAGLAPDDLFGGFAELVAARKQELDAMRAEEPAEEPSRWDTHPPIATRIAAMAAAPDASGPVDGRPAAVLVPDLGGLARQMQRELVSVGDRTVLSWPDFTAAAIAADMQRSADHIFRLLNRLTGATDAGLPELLDLVAAGRLGELAEELFPNATRREAAAQFAGPMEHLLVLAAIHSGVARWWHSWSEPAQLVGPDGRPFDLSDIAALAVAPQTLPEARQRLAAWGIETQRAALVERRATATGAEVIAGLANVKVNGVEHDLLVLTRGLVFVAKPGSSNGGRQRMHELLSGSPVAQLAERNPFLPFEEVADVTITKRVPARVELTLHNGRTVAVHEGWGSDLLEKHSRDTLLTALDRLS